MSSYNLKENAFKTKQQMSNKAELKKILNLPENWILFKELVDEGQLQYYEEEQSILSKKNIKTLVEIEKESLRIKDEFFSSSTMMENHFSELGSDLGTNISKLTILVSEVWDKLIIQKEEKVIKNKETKNVKK